jgi:hypothetical protein
VVMPPGHTTSESTTFVAVWIANLRVWQAALPTGYLGFVKILKNLGTNFDNGSLRSKPTLYRSPPAQRGSQGYQQKRAPAATDDAMDWEPTRISKLTQRQNLELADKQTK